MDTITLAEKWEERPVRRIARAPHKHQSEHWMIKANSAGFWTEMKAMEIRLLGWIILIVGLAVGILKLMATS